jgi:hypothetical protein
MLMGHGARLVRMAVDHRLELVNIRVVVVVIVVHDRDVRGYSRLAHE